MRILKKKFNIIPLEDDELRREAQKEISKIRGVMLVDIAKRWIRLEYDEKADVKEIGRMLQKAGIEKRTTFFDGFL